MTGPAHDDTGVVWREAMPFDDLWIGDLVGVEVDGHQVLLVNVDDEIRAYRDRCPHQESPLSDGDLDGSLLTCATHLWEFDALSGCGVNPDDSQLTGYPVRVEDGMIHVGLPDNVATTSGSTADAG